MLISRMIDDMLQLVRLGSALDLNLQPVDLKGFIQQVVHEYESLAQTKQLSWQFDLEPSCAIPLDAHHMKRALSEIVHNAIQYTEPSGRINIDLCQYEHEIGIRVHDTGVGIDPAHMGKIFNRLYRVDEARTQRGTGLGLSIAKLIIEAHHGRIMVESVVGQGSKFEIILPRS